MPAKATAQGLCPMEHPRVCLPQRIFCLRIRPTFSFGLEKTQSSIGRNPAHHGSAGHAEGDDEEPYQTPSQSPGVSQQHCPLLVRLLATVDSSYLEI